MDGAGPLTRSMTELSTSGFINEDALHWSIESYIPIETPDLLEYLSSRGELSAEQIKSLQSHERMLENVLDRRTGAYHTEFSKLYGPVDPDFDGKIPAGAQRANVEGNVEQLMELGGRILDAASYRRLTQQEIEQCVGVASQFGVRLQVDFDLFDQLAVYARGDITGTRLRRRLRRLYQPESIDVPIYQRMVVIFSLRDDIESLEALAAAALHLRMFKNIPQQDVDMLLPGARVRLSRVDRAKIIVPSLGGFLLALRKIIQFVVILAALTLYKTVVLVGLVLVAIGYVVKSFLSYFHTKDRHLLNLTRNLYFQKLDSNAGVAYRIMQQAHRQADAEGVLALYAIMSSDQPISTRKLRRRCERLLREAIEIEVAFQVERALELLRDVKLVQTDAQGRWQLSQEQQNPV